MIQTNTLASFSSNYSIPPAQLWVGQHEQTVQEIEQLLQKTLCSQQGCQTCVTCMQIRNRQHHAVMWFYPDKTYTLDQLEGLFSTIAYALQPNEKFFFIIQKADFLSSICANKLLKPMEEPPTGYHFVLLAEHTENILPTILSRCMVHTLTSRTDNYTHHLLFQCFTTQHCSITDFSKIIDTSGINERESVELFNEILHYWIQQSNSNMSDDKAHLRQAFIKTIKNASRKLPMPGSSSTFWRNLYLQSTQTLQSINR